MNRWIVGARPRTLPAAVVPVVLGAAVAVGEAGAAWWRLAFALVVSLALQVGVNYANDYSDGVRGTDEDRVGPVRLVASGLATAGEVKRAAIAAMAVAAAAGLVLAVTTSWWLLVVGATAVLAAWGYTGGPKPYGYLGFGELFVFVYFGLVATAGTTFVILRRLPALSWIAGALAGFLACALLVINNLRDIPTDAAAGKRTLAVRLGDSRTRVLYTVLLAAAAAAVAACGAAGRSWALIGLGAFPLASPGVAAMRASATGRQLIPVLARTGQVQLAVGVLTAAGLALSGVMSG